LDGGKILLPPQVLLVLGSKCGDQVVRVHDDVDKSVQESEESGVTAWGKFDAEPHRHGHDPVVDHVEGRNVVVFLPQNEEDLEEDYWVERESKRLMGTNRI
jgi:hypothetical protein